MGSDGSPFSPLAWIGPLLALQCPLRGAWPKSPGGTRAS